jgi:hypothetical protein
VASQRGAGGTVVTRAGRCAQASKSTAAESEAKPATPLMVLLKRRARALM